MLLQSQKCTNIEEFTTTEVKQRGIGTLLVMNTMTLKKNGKCFVNKLAGLKHGITNIENTRNLISYAQIVEPLTLILLERKRIWRKKNVRTVLRISKTCMKNI